MNYTGGKVELINIKKVHKYKMNMLLCVCEGIEIT